MRDLTDRRTILDGLIASHRGRIANTGGDSVLAEFGSAVDAVQCAVEAQAALTGANGDLSPERHIKFRIGVHVGDVMIRGGDLFGDSVNVAARLEGIAESGGVCISDDAYRQIRGKVEIACDDLGPQTLKNIAEPMRAWRVRLTGQTPSVVKSGSAVSQPRTIPLPDKPSIAVLPFQNMSGDQEQDYFCDGLVEDIITTLSKLPRLRVIARNSSSVYKGRPIDVREAARQLGVQYILEGSVRKSGNRIRVTAQLIDANDGVHLWAERYDRAVDDIFAIQDEITLVIATEMQVKLTEGEQARLRYTTTQNVEAWTLWVQGMAYFQHGPIKDKNTSARLCWEKALALDPNSAALNAMLGFLHIIDARFDWWDDRATALGKARAYADRALELDPRNADAHITSGCVFLMRGHHEEAAVDARTAIELAPGSADVASFASFILTPSGYPEEAAVQSEKAIALSPHYPAHYLGPLGDAYRLLGRPEKAIAAFNACHARSPGFGLTDLVITYQEMGRAEEARRTAEQLMSARPNFTIGGWLKTQFIRRDTARVKTDTEALRAAGLPMS